MSALDHEFRAIREEGQRAGYRKGENERIALAAANSNLRTDLREANAECLRLYGLLSEVEDAVNVDSHPSYSADGPSWKTSAITTVRKVIEGI